MASQIAVLLVLCIFAPIAFAATWDRAAAQVVENGTHFNREDFGVTIEEPSESTVFRRVHEEEGHSKRDSGWIASVWTFYTPLTYYSAVWHVPARPANPSGQILFFFNSFENSAYNDILQPVLQFNNGVAGWTLASWYGANGNYFESTPVAVNVGDTITGIISYSGSAWSVEGYVNGNLKTLLTVSTIGTQSNAQFALEVYTVSQCAQYPPSNSLQVTNIVMKSGSTTVTPSWGPSVNSNSCNAGASGTSTTATITWQSGSGGVSTSGCGSGLNFCPGNGQCYSSGSYVCSGTYPYLCPTSAPHFCNGGCASSSC